MQVSNPCPDYFEQINKQPMTEKNLTKNLSQWAIYSLIFMILLIPFTEITLKTLTGGIILGFFAGILNAINSKLKS